MKNRLLIALGLASTFALSACPPVANTDDEDFFSLSTINNELQRQIDELEQRIEYLRNKMEMNASMEHVQTDLEELADGSGIQISVKGLELKEHNLEADFDADDNRLSIKTSAGTVTVQAHGHYLSVGFKKQETKERSDKMVSHLALAVASHVARSLGHEVILEQASLEYDAHNKTLLISVPYKKKTHHKLAVNMIVRDAASAAPHYERNKENKEVVK